MKTFNDYSRQASRFTMSGLIDPRVMPGYVPAKERAASSIQFGLLVTVITKFVERITGKKADKGAAHA